MEDLQVKLEEIRDLARSRVRMLNEDISIYDDDKKAFYLREYESKINELDRLLHDLPLRQIPSHEHEKPSGLKRCWDRLFGDGT